MSRAADRIAIVAGANRSIGREIAAQVAAAGVRPCALAGADDVTLDVKRLEVTRQDRIHALAERLR
jgi:NAD(P)-dependent dehydrogenase (short-subunit alcohol dehydrogenase family)